MGVRIDWQQDELTATLDAARDSEVVLPFPSVGATENVLLLAAAIPCVTVLRGAAKEPEIVDLAHMLCEMGAAVEGAGGDVITVRGARELRGVRHRGAVRPHCGSHRFVRRRHHGRQPDAVRRQHPAYGQRA